MSRIVATLVYSKTIGSVHRKAILAYMADRASDDGSGVWCSKQTIANETEVSRSTVIKTINEFVSEGLLIQTGTRKCLNGATIEYQINLPAVAALPNIGERPQHAQPQEHQYASRTSPDLDTSASRTRPVRQPDPMPSASRTQTVLEPSINQGADAPLECARDAVPVEDQPQRRPPRRSVALPPDWVPSERNISDAFDRNFTEEEIHEQAGAFRDHHLAKGTTFKDWDAGWRTWLANARRFGRSASAPHARNRGPHHALAQGFQRAAARERG